MNMQPETIGAHEQCNTGVANANFILAGVASRIVTATNADAVFAEVSAHCASESPHARRPDPLACAALSQCATAFDKR